MKTKTPNHPFRRSSDIGAIDDDFKTDPKEAAVDTFWTTLVIAAAGLASLYLIGVATTGDYPGQD